MIYSIHYFYYLSFYGMNLLNMFGYLLFSMFIIQFITGVLLVCYFNNMYIIAFDSILYIMMEVMFGFLISWFHCLFAGLFIILLYLHMFSGVYMSLLIIDSLSFVWFSGIILFSLSFMEGFMGYMLNFGQMSYWGYMVLIGLLSMLGMFEYMLMEMLWCCCYVVVFSMFCLHFIMGWLLGMFMIIHMWMLHAFSSMNPSILSYSSFIISFYLVIFKDICLGIIYMYIIYLLYYHPDIMGNADNLMFANPLSTPDHMVPEFYFLVIFYMLRSMSTKALGIISILYFMVYIML